MTGLGLIHIYTGPGKGKTTAAVGLAVRAAGRGIPVVFVQLMKNRPTGEVEVLSRLPGVTVLRGKAGAGFSSAMTPEERARSREIHHRNLCQGAELAREQGGLLVLDEVMAALKHGLLDREPLQQLLDRRPEGTELVLTGRDAPEWLLEWADYITVMEKRRHPYDRGIAARPGIEE